MPVIVVTDSASRLPEQLAQRFGIRQVPLHVTMPDGRDFLDGVDEVPDEVIDTPGVTTSGANPAEIGEVYAEALEASEGDGVIAVHLSRRLSGTWGAARLAAEEHVGRIRVVDSRSVGLAVGFTALGAAQAAAAGGDLDRVYEAAIRNAATGESLLLAQQLDNLRASGRISAAGRMLGSALSIKPILHITDGVLTLRERQRTTSRAFAKLADTAVELAEGRSVTLGIQHCRADEAAADLRDELLDRLAPVVSVMTVDLGPILSVHVGAGAVGLVLGRHLEPLEGYQTP